MPLVALAIGGMAQVRPATHHPPVAGRGPARRDRRTPTGRAPIAGTPNQWAHHCRTFPVMLNSPNPFGGYLCILVCGHDGYPAHFPRAIQAAIWIVCTGSELDDCNAANVGKGRPCNIAGGCPVAGVSARGRRRR